MIEFSRQHYLWLLAVIVVWFVAWLFARRYTSRRVTYGAIWRQVAAKALPPAWKRILKTLLTWAFALTLIASAAMHAAGAEKPHSEKPPPLFILICLDNSYSMRLQHDGQTRLQLAHDRAAQILENLQPEDRAVLVWSSNGQPIAGPILKQSDSIQDSPATDVAELSAKDLQKFADELSLPAQENGWQKLVWWLSDRELKAQTAEFSGRAKFIGQRLGESAFVSELIGGSVRNQGIQTAAYKLMDANFEHAAELDFEADGEVFLSLNGEKSAVQSPAKLPRSSQPLDVRLFIKGQDGLPEDNAIEFRLEGDGLHNIVLCYPAADSGPNILLVELLETLLPGREVLPVAVSAGLAELPDDIDLLVADRALPTSASAASTLYFGVISSDRGEVKSAVTAEPNMQIHPKVKLQGWGAPDLRLVSARHAVPVDVSTLATIMVKHRLGGALVAVGDGWLYSGFIPHKSTLLSDGEGILLLMRWLRFIGQPDTSNSPLLAIAGQESNVALGNGKWDFAAEDESYQDTTSRTLQPAANGQLQFTTPNAPVQWRLQQGNSVRSVKLFASPDWPLRLSMEKKAPLDLSRLAPQEENQDWRDLLPALLLWIAASVLVLGQLCWLIGLTE